MNGGAIRVLALVKQLSFGGTERLIELQARAAADAYDFCVAYIDPRQPDVEEPLRAAGAETTCLGRGWTGGLLWPYRLAKLLMGQRPDVLHIHSPRAAAVARPIARAFGIPIVYTEHGMWDLYHPATRLANRLTFGLDTHDLAVSQAVADHITHRSGRSIEVLVHGVDLERLGHPSLRAKGRVALGIPDGPPVVMTVAKLRPEKGAFDLLDAIGHIPAEVGVNFVWIGAGPLEAEFLDGIKQRGVGDRLIYLGNRSDAAELVAASDVFCLPSHNEGLPVALMEAMATGTPIVGTEVGGVPGAIHHPLSCGITVAPHSPKLLAEAVMTVVDSPELQDRYAQAARVNAKSYDFDVCHRRLTELYRNVSV